MKDARTPCNDPPSARPDVRGEAGSTTGKPSGRAGVDERGNAVWEWRVSTGVYSRDPDTLRLRQLASSELAIAETARNKRLQERPDGQGVSPSRGLDRTAAGSTRAAGGFEPYDRSGVSGGGGFNPYDRAGSLAGRGAAMPRAGQKAPPARRAPVDLHKLDAWIKLKKRLLRQKG